jgi:hypothetical protein
MKRILIAAVLSLTASVQAQDFPARAINLIVPNPPGGMNQIHAQPLGAVIEKPYKQPAPVINKPVRLPRREPATWRISRPTAITCWSRLEPVLSRLKRQTVRHPVAVHARADCADRAAERGPARAVRAI